MGAGYVCIWTSNGLTVHVGAFANVKLPILLNTILKDSLVEWALASFALIKEIDYIA